MGVTDEWQALQEAGPDAFDADPTNGEYDPDTGEVEDPNDAAASLAEDTISQGAVPDWLAQSDSGGGSGEVSTDASLLGNQTVVLAGGIALLALLMVVID